MTKHSIGPIERGIGFGLFALFPSQRLLLKDGVPVELGARALDILAHLASRHGEIVSKEALLAKAWPGVFVEEVNLRVSVSSIRRALGDGVDGQRFLKTIPGQGYCFVAPVVELRDTAREPSRTPAPWLPRRAREVVGRDAVITSLIGTLARERLVTIVGPAGIGKTTIAVAAAERAQANSPDGGAFVDLAHVSDPAAVLGSVAMSLGLTQMQAPDVRSVAAALRHRRVLLVVDNCEHLIEGVAAVLDTLLTETESVRVIATSREPLGLGGEKLQRLAPLDVSQEARIRTADEARAVPAIQLFEQRARAARPGFEIDDANAAILAEICRQLDGVPFAIELAASRIDTFGLAELKAQLDDHISVLDYAGARFAPSHQRSVRDALAWSFELLPAPERTLLRRLSVFAGSFALEDAVELASLAHTASGSTIDGIAALASKSLVSVEFRGQQARYRLLETTRIYAAERLTQDDDPALWRGRHADLVKARLQRAGFVPSTETAEQAMDVAQLLDDLRAAHDWSLTDSAQAETAADLALAAVPLWAQLSLHEESRRRAEAALRRLEGLKIERNREMALKAALGLSIMYAEGPGGKAVTALAEALHAARQLGDDERERQMLWALWSCAINGGTYLETVGLAQQFAEAAKGSIQSGDRLIAERMLGLSYHYAGEFNLARTHTEAMLSRYVRPPDGRDIRRYQFDQRILAEVILGPILWILGFTDQARTIADRYLGEAKSLAHPLTLIYAIAQHAFQCVCLSGDVESAQRDFEDLSELAERLPWSPAGGFLAMLSSALDARLGDAAAGAARLELVLQRQAAAGIYQGYTNALGFLATGWRRAGDLARALVAIDDALERSERCGEFWCHPELVRIKGEILLDRGQASEAETIFKAAVHEAREKEALGWELKAATNLGQIWACSGRKIQARELLRTICAEFSEGFETAELKAALSHLNSLD